MKIIMVKPLANANEMTFYTFSVLANGQRYIASEPPSLDAPCSEWQVWALNRSGAMEHSETGTLAHEIGALCKAEANRLRAQ
jgi:hypothetical protein